MGVRHAVVVVGTTPVALNAVEQTGDASQSLMISVDSGTIFVGGSNVTTTVYGFKVTSTAPLAVDLGAYDTLYAVATSNVNVNVLYVGA